MRVAAFSIRQFEKDLLRVENRNYHEIEFFSQPLSSETVHLVKDCIGVLVFVNDDLSAAIIEQLAKLGIKYIVTRSVGTDHIDKLAAAKWGIKIANVPAYSPEAIAEHAVMLALALARKLVPTIDQTRNFDFSLENHLGFNLNGKTVGIVGLGNIGKAAASIFSGFGCRVIANDVVLQDFKPQVEQTTFHQVLQESDIISLHVPLNSETRYLINRESIETMKTGVMIINTARGGLIDTEAILEALEAGKIGCIGLDVYENEKGLFFADHHQDKQRDPLLSRLMSHDSVIVTPHQAFLTREAVTEIARATVNNLSHWDKINLGGFQETL